MLEIQLGGGGPASVLALPVVPPEEGATGSLGETGYPIPDDLRAEAEALVEAVEHSGAAGSVHSMHRPGREPRRLFLLGIGSAAEADWRAAGAALVRVAEREPALSVAIPTQSPARAVRGLAEGAWLGSYFFSGTGQEPDERRRLARLDLAVSADEQTDGALARARAVASATVLARDLTNTPSGVKSPAWLADQLERAARGRSGLAVRIRDEGDLAREGFGGILAVGAGSVRPPRLVELTWRPERAEAHVVLVGKGITFDTGGISLKPPDAMRLMRKDMGGAAAVAAATLGAAALRLPVRVTALMPLAENMVSGSALRPGDVIRHYGGLTSEVQNTDAEGRLVLADALAYAAAELEPDVLVDLATLTGAQHVALGKRTAALFTPADDLASGLLDAANHVGERLWRMPLAEEYRELLASDVADFNNAPVPGQAGAITAAMYLGEFTGDCRDRWVHVDMSSPSWIESTDGELVKGATGWGVRTLLRWLEASFP